MKRETLVDVITKKNKMSVHELTHVIIERYHLSYDYAIECSYVGSSGTWPQNLSASSSFAL